MQTFKALNKATSVCIHINFHIFGNLEWVFIFPSYCWFFFSDTSMLTTEQCTKNEDIDMFCVCIGLGFGTCNFGFDTLESSQICWSQQQSCNNNLLHVYMEGNCLSQLLNASAVRKNISKIKSWPVPKK